jgi:hypothetical protein
VYLYGSNNYNISYDLTNLQPVIMIYMRTKAEGSGTMSVRLSVWRKRAMDSSFSFISLHIHSIFQLLPSAFWILPCRSHLLTLLSHHRFTAIAYGGLFFTMALSRATQNWPPRPICAPQPIGARKWASQPQGGPEHTATTGAETHTQADPTHWPRGPPKT